MEKEYKAVRQTSFSSTLRYLLEERRIAITEERDASGNYKSTLKERNKKIPQRELSDYIGVKRQMISKYINGEAYPATNKLGKIADFFGVSVDYLLLYYPGCSPANKYENLKKAADAMGIPHLYAFITSFIDLTDEGRDLVRNYEYSLLNTKKYSRARRFIIAHKRRK